KCFPLVRFFHIPSVDFYLHVNPFACIFPVTLYEDLLHHYSVSGSETSKASQYPPRTHSRIIQLYHMKQIVDWITDQDPSFAATKPKFTLLLRGSRDGFTSKDFHRLCDNKGPTVTIIKVKGNGKLIGGYNPISCHGSIWHEPRTRSFLF